MTCDGSSDRVEGVVKLRRRGGPAQGILGES